VRYRLVYIGLGATAVAVVALAIAFGGGGRPTVLPGPVEAVSPGPGDSAIIQTGIDVDLAGGYTADISIDGMPIPPNELTFVEATGVYHWQPEPASLIMDAWTPGPHTVRVSWDTVSGLADPGSFEWTFRVG